MIRMKFLERIEIEKKLSYKNITLIISTYSGSNTLKEDQTKLLSEAASVSLGTGSLTHYASFSLVDHDNNKMNEA